MIAKDFDLYLASTSPRRRELLEQIGVTYQLLSSEIDETPRAGELPENFVVRMALEKAQAGKGDIPSSDHRPVLGADTAVVVKNEILGKPRDKAHGLAMLESLSGCRHKVMSAVALVGAKTDTRLCVSEVKFRSLGREELEAYWNTGEPNDKAGAYGIQGKAAIFIERLEGSYSAVMGLPLCETAELLQEAGIRLLR